MYSPFSFWSHETNKSKLHSEEYETQSAMSNDDRLGNEDGTFVIASAVGSLEVTMDGLFKGIKVGKNVPAMLGE